eukprot:8385064-Prorocentrum_lima.AAC.1
MLKPFDLILARPLQDLDNNKAGRRLQHTARLVVIEVLLRVTASVQAKSPGKKRRPAASAFSSH